MFGDGVKDFFADAALEIIVCPGTVKRGCTVGTEGMAFFVGLQMDGL